MGIANIWKIWPTKKTCMSLGGDTKLRWLLQKMRTLCLSSLLLFYIWEIKHFYWDLIISGSHWCGENLYAANNSWWSVCIPSIRGTEPNDFRSGRLRYWALISCCAAQLLDLLLSKQRLVWVLCHRFSTFDINNIDNNVVIGSQKNARKSGWFC